MPCVCCPTWRHQQRLDVVGVEEFDQVIERADEPAARVRVRPHQLVRLLETLLTALHLKYRRVYSLLS